MASLLHLSISGAWIRRVVDRTFPTMSRTGSRSISRPAKRHKNTGSPFCFRRCWLAVCILHNHFRISCIYKYIYILIYISMHFHVYVLAHVRGQRHSHCIALIVNILSCQTIHELRKYTLEIVHVRNKIAWGKGSPAFL